MLGNLGQIAATVSLNIDPFQVSQRVLNSSIKATAAELRAQDAAFKGSEKSINNMRSTYDTLSRQSKNYQAQLQKQREQYDENSKAVERLNKSETASQEEINRATKLQANAASQYNRTAAAAAQNENRMAALRKEIALQSDGWTKVSNGASKFASVTEKASSKLTSFGSTMTRAVTAPIAIGFVAAAKSAIDFNSQIQAMGPLLTNGGAITAKYRAQLDQLASASKKWSVEYGVSTAAINDGMSEMIKRGYTAAQTLGAMPAVLNAAKASGDDFNDVMHVSTSVLEQFGLKTESTTGMLKNTSRVTDALTYIANATAAGFQDMGEAMTYVGPSAHAAGISLEETAAAIGIMSNKGIEGSVAGTALRGALTRLLKPSKQNLQGFNELGISVADFKKGTLTLPEILDKIKNNTKGWTDQQRASAVALAFGTEAQAGMNALISAGGGELRKYTSEAEHASGKTAKIANQLNNTDAAKLKRFQESIHVLGIEVGQKLLPTLTPLIKTATDVVNAFTKMDSGTQQTIIKFAAFAAVVGPMSSLIGGALMPVAALSRGISRITGVVGRFRVAGELGASGASRLGATFSKTAFEALKVAPAATTAANGTSEMGAAMAGASTGGTSFLASLAPIAPAILSVALVAGAGIAIWELWGKKAVEADNRVSRWGTDIGADADRSASKMKDASGKISGAFDDTNHTVTQNAKTISKGFNDLTKAAKEAADQSETTAKKLAKSLGGEAAENIEKQAAKEKAANAKRIKEMESNNEKAQAITASFNKSGAQMTADQYQLLDNYRRKNATLAVKTLQISGSQQNNVLKAVLGERTRMSKSAALEQYQDMWNAANKENSAYKSQQAKINEEFKNDATMRHVALEGLERDHQNKMKSLYAGAIQAMKAQGTSRSEMLAELQTDFHLTSSQAESAMSSYEKSMAKGVKSNRDFAAATEGFGKAAQEAGDHWNSLVFDPKTGKVKTNLPEVLKDTASTKKGWQQLKFDLKNAKITSNAKQMIVEALASSKQWQKLSVPEKNAIIRTQGREQLADIMDKFISWNSLSLKDQQAIVKGDYTPLVNALVKSGDWNNLTLKQQEAIVKDKATAPLVSSLQQTGEWQKLDLKVQEAIVNAKGKKDLEDILFDMGVWNKLPNTQKYATLVSLGKQDIADIIDQLNLWNTLTPKEIEAVAKGDTSSLVAAIDKANDWNRLTLGQLEAIVKDKASAGLVQAMIKAGEWNGLSIEEKTAIMQTKGKSDLADMVVKYGLWNSLPNSTKSLLMNDSDARTKLEKAGVAIDQYNLFKNPNEKGLKANNTDVLGKTEEAKGSIQKYNEVLPGLKFFNGNSSGVKTESSSGQSSIIRYNEVLPGLKLFNGNSSSVNGASESGQSSIILFNGTNPVLKPFKGDSSSVNSESAKGQSSILLFNSKDPLMRLFNGDASGVSEASRIGVNAVAAFGGNATITKTFRISADVDPAVQRLLNSGRFARGTQNFTGGLATINDASGTRYQEVVTLPNGAKFVAYGRNVTLPLPRHTKIETAMQSARNYSIPRFAGGTTDFGGAANRINQLNPQTFVTSISSGSNSRVEDLLARLIELTTYQISNPSVPEGKVVLDNGREVGRWLYPTINKLKNRDTIMSNRRRGIF
ncbi:phage tail tape measure protein [Lacticaseibacillus rhamnosus]|uniref:phage tail tape measure protein n=2 Tax=Lactobacillales TaxID=186826 RepID=UPI0022AA33C2|nr:phage tail tape measure protein [Lacticaseibacillus rhamnosus]MCZ2733107.1 phage tail tape measure protein [Lacticaseibacillus rhamnosus]MCZ2735700.1 phage tail tape measure protein [Lacticaseibacillus rhamnosus]MCZ2742089.1 phage tail tape measure protein [Lacticaseibacillus rhamnosus]MCZ2744868.1 phage tail tape measure protein [Lacticaseibacillus rhamnosus]MCZ2747517.1 phage tail tape measure protein [Lacticaseibacillus rhamnosus]